MPTLRLAARAPERAPSRRRRSRSPATISWRRAATRAGLLSATCAATLLGACGGDGKPAASGARGRGATPVGVVRVERTDLAYVVEGTGSLEAYQVVVVPTTIDGVVETVSFDEGTRVDPKFVLAVVDRTRRALERDEAQASVTRAEAAIPRLRAAVGRTDAALDRARAQERAATSDLAESDDALARREQVRRDAPGAVTEDEVARLRAEVLRRREALTVTQAMGREATAAGAEATAAVAEGDAEAAAARAHLALAEKTLRDAEVRSPIPGVVRRRLVTLGEHVSAGDGVAEIVDRSRLRVRFRVSEAESVRLAPDMDATFLVPALSEARHAAKIVHVDESASPVTRMVECLAEVVAPDPTLKPGFYARVSVTTKTARAIAVPESVLQPGEDGWRAYVVEDGKARARAVGRGLRTADGLVEVVDGLKEGDVLVVTGGNVLSDGMSVAPSAPKVDAAAVPASEDRSDEAIERRGTRSGAPPAAPPVAPATPPATPDAPTAPR